MSRQGPHLDSWEWEKNRREKIAAKLQKIEGLRALLQMWEENPNHDHEYILELRRKLRSAENQLAAMTI
jgi:hypothetical protein